MPRTNDTPIHVILWYALGHCALCFCIGYFLVGGVIKLIWPELGVAANAPG
jgi:hypothetical protein